MIRINKVLKEYPNFSIEIENCNYNDNSLICILGSNGSGKTTLFKMISNMTTYKGQIYIDGFDTKKSDNWKKLTSTFLGEEYLLDFLKRDEYLDFFCTSYNIDFNTVLISDVFLNALYNSIPEKKLIREYSKGNKAKIGVLSVLLSNTKNMIFDEPFANLDIETQINLSSYLEKIKQYKTIILSTHHKEIVSNYCDKIVHIENGEIIMGSN